MKKPTETDAEILARNIPPKRPQNGSLHPACSQMHEYSFCICLTVECVFCQKRHPPHKQCPKESP